MGAHHLWTDQEAYLNGQRELQGALDPAGKTFAIKITDDGDREKVYYTSKFMWGELLSNLSVDLIRPHPRLGVQAQNLIRLIDIATQWKPHQHIACGPVQYMMDHHPVSRQQVGIRWIGWVPFSLAPADVPDAQIVQPMNNGTLIVTQARFWQAHPNHPDYSADAIGRSQAVELRLNELGVLPTGKDLSKGDWGNASR